VLKDPRVVAATLTGSEPAGSSVAGIAGKQIKKTVLELGGSDPFIVMPSADLKEAVSTAVKARTINNGQSCIAAKRFIVAAEVYSQFEKKFVEEMKALRVGDPLEETTDIGPLATPQIVDDLEEQVKKAVASGARILTGGKRLERPGNFYEPTVLVGLDPSAPVSCEEIFGPVAMLFRVNDIDEAIRIANATPFGPLYRRARSRLCVHQRHGRFRPASAVWRRQAFRLRPRARGIRHPRVREHQNRLDR
jgi:succinate-semialdehyde dehydrogenase/glutarate-semialdehyde dehydrogenase